MTTKPTAQAAEQHAVKCWLYRRLNRFAEHGGRFVDNLANAYHDYEKITANSERGLPVRFVDESEIRNLTFAEVCSWIAEYAAAQKLVEGKG